MMSRMALSIFSLSILAVAAALVVLVVVGGQTLLSQLQAIRQPTPTPAWSVVCYLVPTRHCVVTEQRTIQGEPRTEQFVVLGDVINIKGRDGRILSFDTWPYDWVWPDKRVPLEKLHRQDGEP